jgi:hypothetical protein
MRSNFGYELFVPGSVLGEYGVVTGFGRVKGSVATGVDSANFSHAFLWTKGFYGRKLIFRESFIGFYSAFSSGIE